MQQVQGAQRDSGLNVDDSSLEDMAGGRGRKVSGEQSSDESSDENDQYPDQDSRERDRNNSDMFGAVDSQSLDNPDGESEGENEGDFAQALNDHHQEQEMREMIAEGAAKRKMLQIANRIAETTPQIIDRESKKKMSILEHVRKAGEEKGVKRVMKMIKEETKEIADASQKLLIEKRRQNAYTKGLNLDLDKQVPPVQDEVYDECGVDYRTKCEDEDQKYREEQDETTYLRDLMLKKQEDYIFREQEYRTTIKMLKETIDNVSYHPLKKEIDPSKDQQKLELIKSQLNLNESDSDSNSGSDEDEKDDPFAGDGLQAQADRQHQMNQAARHQKPVPGEEDGMGTTMLNNHKKNVKQINEHKPNIDMEIEKFQMTTHDHLAVKRKQKLEEFDQKLQKLMQELDDAKQEQMDNKTDFKENEKKLQEKLETMTSMAEKIDENNRQLIKINNDLKIQYLAQKGQGDIKGDREILIKQILHAKKKGNNITDKHAELTRQVEEINKQREQTEKILSQGKQQRRNIPPPSGFKNTGTAFHQASGSLSKDTSNKNFGEVGNAQLAYQLNMRQNINKGRTGTAPKVVGEDMFNRPHTAAMLFQAANSGASRPYTGNQAGHFGQTRPAGPGMNSNQNLHRGGLQGMQGAGRAASAGFSVANTKIARYEDLINRLKKLLDNEKKNLRLVKTMSASEIDTRNHLESILRKCVTDVQDEIARKRSQNTSNYYAKGRKGQSELAEEKNLTQLEKEKIIEVLLSQERVLTLLYDKTFPPNNPNQNRAGGNVIGAALKPSSSLYGLKTGNSMLQFNYHGQNPNAQGMQPATFNPADETDDMNLEALEREVEEAVRCGTASAPRHGHQNRDPNNLPSHGFRGAGSRHKVSQTAHGGRRNRLPPHPVQRKRQGSEYRIGYKLTKNQGGVQHGAFV